MHEIYRKSIKHSYNVPKNGFYFQHVNDAWEILCILKIINIQFHACVSRVTFIWREMVVLHFAKRTIFLGSKILQKRLSMRPRKQKHPKYKAYFSHQLRILKERFPFLSSQQIKAKILSTWEGLSPEKKNDWGILPKAKLQNGR